MLHKLTELCGWIGMVLIHAATVPVTVRLIIDSGAARPPLDMVLLVWAGLFLFLIRAVGRKDTLYIVSNAIGFFANSVLMALIVFGG
tara:strand:+ start:2975 stop:3235 length:261 start_codon:yes stop_codon:yes gene_type:complete